MSATATLPFGMLHQEDPSIEAKRGYSYEEVPVQYEPNNQMNRNFSIQMAKTWSMVTSSGSIFERNDPDQKEDDGK